MAAIAKTNHRAALRRAVARAILAPSVHNTQPWRFELDDEHLDLHGDPTRQLRALDPTTRQLTISCGCALFNARVSLAASGLDAVVARFPDPARPTLLARLTAHDLAAAHDRAAAHDLAAEQVDALWRLDAVVELRQTNRRRFADEAVPPEVVAGLERAAVAEDSRLFVVRTEDHRRAVAMLSQRADDIQNLDPAYRAEIRAWTTDDPQRRDGVPAMAVPHVDGASEDEIPIRDFDSRGMGWLPSLTKSSRNQCLLLLGSDGDQPADWLRAGEALERMLLEITRHGFVASPLTQVVEVASARAALRRELSLTMYPLVLLRVGRAPVTPASHRRGVLEVLVEHA